MFSRTMEASRDSRALALLTVALLALVCLWLLVRLAATLLDRGATTSPGGLRPVPADILAAPAESLAGWHLFGNAAPVADPRRPAGNAPETDQPLSLVGVLAEQDPALGVAFIADAGGSQSAYRVGAELPGGSRLRAVHGDHVVLDRGGSTESLSLARRDGAGSAVAAGAGPAASATASDPAAVIAPSIAPIVPEIAGSGSVDWAEVQRQIEVDPAELARQVRVMPVMEGGAVIGMRLSGGSAAPLIARAGLQPDDIVTAVNGISVRDVGRAQQILASVREADRVSITVRRDGREQTLNVDLK